MNLLVYSGFLLVFTFIFSFSIIASANFMIFYVRLWLNHIIVVFFNFFKKKFFNWPGINRFISFIDVNKDF